ncbi:MAG: PP2C family protein-serine/threonine phosphatase [Blastocatellales bacterium]
MTNRRLVMLSALALIGYCGLFFLFPKTNPAARWNFELDRAAAIEKVKALAASYDHTAFVQTGSGQSETAVVDYHLDDEYYLSRQTNPLLGSLFTPLTVRVRLADAKSGSGFEARLNSRGEVLEYRRREQPAKKPQAPQADDAPQQAPAPDALANDQKIADEALKRFLGERYGKFSLLPGSNTGKENKKFSWAASDDGIRVLADVIVRAGKVTEIRLRSNLTPKFQAEFGARRGGVMVALSSAVNLLVWPAIILVIILYFIGLAQRRIDHRKTLVFLACCFLLLLTTNLFGSFADDFRGDFRISNDPLPYSLSVAIQWAVFALVHLFIAVGLYLFLAPGLSLSARSANRGTIDLELLLKGKLLKRPVTGGIVAGLLSGGLLALIAHAVAATGVFTGATVNAGELEGVLAARTPSADAFFDGDQFLIFVSFAFLIPAAEAFVKRLWLQRILSFVIVFITMAGLEPFRTSAPAAVVTSLLQAYLLIWLYRNFGLLAVLISTMASEAAVSSATLLAQHSTALQASGRQAMIGLGVALIAALIGYWKSSEAKEEEIAVKTPVENRAERDRLQAEFGVARRAQQHMLPDAPPPVPGMEISAVCIPSRDVGGDLYDFLALPDGKLGVVVADVSGKGVPASLYMTLTKGLLDSVTEHKTDPGEILREVNRHLYDVCRRKTFVTMFLGVIDPGRKTLSYARAGHNPTVIHRSSESKTWMLKSPGMGLGLNSGKIFDQSLKVETVQLKQGDILFFYSDGITEAMNAKRDEYGEERLMMMAERTNGLNAEQSRDAVMADVAEFLGQVQPQDDQTLVVLQIL